MATNQPPPESSQPASSPTPEQQDLPPEELEGTIAEPEPVTGHVEHFHVGDVRQFGRDQIAATQLKVPQSRPPWGVDEDGEPRPAPWAAQEADEPDAEADERERERENAPRSQTGTRQHEPSQRARPPAQPSTKD